MPIKIFLVQKKIAFTISDGSLKIWECWPKRTEEEQTKGDTSVIPSNIEPLAWTSLQKGISIHYRSERIFLQTLISFWGSLIRGNSMMLIVRKSQECNNTATSSLHHRHTPPIFSVEQLGTKIDSFTANYYSRYCNYVAQFFSSCFSVNFNWELFYWTSNNLWINEGRITWENDPLQWKIFTVTQMGDSKGVYTEKFFLIKMFWATDGFYKKSFRSS